MLEQKINEVFGDSGPTGFGTGWWSGVLSTFFGVLAFGAVLCLHFPQLLSSPDLRPYYPMHLMRLAIQGVIAGAIFFGVVSAMLRRKRPSSLRARRRVASNDTKFLLMARRSFLIT